jgi:WD40 repeat protein
MLALLLFAAAPPLDDPLPPGAIARLGASFLDGRFHAFDVAFRPDGKLVYSGGGIGVGVWDIERKRQLALHPGGPFYRAVPVGDAVLIQGYSLLLVEPGKRPRWNRTEGLSSDLDIGHGGKWFVTTHHRGDLLFCNLHDGKDARRVRVAKPAAAGLPIRLACCPTRPEVALVTPDGYVTVWAREKDAPLWYAIGHSRAREGDRLGAAAYSRDGATLATASTDGTVRLWNALSGASGRVLHRGAEMVHALTFSSKGTLAAALDDGTIRLFDLAAGKQRVLHAGAAQHRLSFSADGRLLASASVNRQSAELWDVARGERLQPQEGHLDAVSALRFVAEDRIVSVDHGGRIVDWKVGAGSTTAGLPFRRPSHRRFALSPDGSKVAESGWPAALYDTADGKRTARLAEEGEYVYLLAFTAGGLAGNLRGQVRRWKLDGSKAGPAVKFDGSAWSYFNPDGKRVVTSFGQMMAEVDLASGMRRDVQDQYRPPFQPAMAGYNADGSYLAWTTFGQVILADTHTWEMVLVLPHEGSMPAAAALSRDGRRLAVTRLGESANSILCYDAVTGKKLLDRPLPPSVLMHCPPDFSPDGSRLATASGRTILVWEVPPVEKGGPLDDAALRRCWDRLAGAPSEAHRAAWDLVDAKAARFVAERAQPVEPADAKLLRQLIGDLDDDDFEKRSAAEAALKKLGRRAEAAMLSALAGKPSLDTYRRLEGLLAAAEALPEWRRLARGVSVLARLGEKKALERLASQKVDIRLAREAREALGRLP